VSTADVSGRVQRWADRSWTIPVLRIPASFGWTRSARVLAIVLWAAFLLNALVVERPDLLDPGNIGSDSANYVAAAERLATGGSIYRIRPGDRPVPADNAPDWTVPILSPPTVPTLFLPTTLAPPPIRPYIVWSIGAAGTIAAGLLLAVTAPLWVLAIALFFAPGLAATAWSGNVNALIAACVPVLYLAASTSDRWRAIASGVLLGALTLLKLGPLMLIPWLIGTRQWVAIASAGLTILAGVVAAAVVAGIDGFGDFAQVTRASVAQPSAWSLPSLIARLGLPSPLPIVLFVLVLAGIGLYALRFPGRPSAFVASAFASAIGTTVVRAEGLAVGITSGVAFRTERRAMQPRRRLGVAAAVWVAGTAAAATAVACSMASGGLSSSSMTLTNATGTPVVVRFGVASQSASFGYTLGPKENVTAWRDGGGAPRVAYAWTPDCRLISEVLIPRTGGHLTYTDHGLEVMNEPRPDLPFATPDDQCSETLKARLELRLVAP
jgi:hypothetical protein